MKTANASERTESLLCRQNTFLNVSRRAESCRKTLSFTKRGNKISPDCFYITLLLILQFISSVHFISVLFSGTTCNVSSPKTSVRKGSTPLRWTFRFCPLFLLS